MSCRIYQLIDVLEPEIRWHLGTPIDSEGKEVDPRIFTDAKPIHFSKKLFIPITEGAQPLDFTFGPFDMPVVHRRVGAKLAEVAAESVQRISVVVEPQTTDYEVLNVIVDLPCLDEARSEVIWWGPGDGRPERIGTYRRLGRKVLRSDLIDGQKLFRLRGWLVALFVDHKTKELMEEMNVTGVTFEEVLVV